MICNNLKSVCIAVFVLHTALLYGQADTHTKMDTSINYLHQEKASFKSQFYQRMFSFFGVKKIIEKKITKNNFNEVPASIPRVLKNNFSIIETTIGDQQVWTVSPLNDSVDSP